MAFCVPTPAALPPASLAGGDAARPGQPSSPERPSARHSAARPGQAPQEGRASGVSWGAGLGKGGRESGGRYSLLAFEVYQSIERGRIISMHHPPRLSVVQSSEKRRARGT